MNRILPVIACIAILTFTSHGNSAPSECAEIKATIAAKNSALKKQIESLKFLLGMGGISTQPLEQLFQIDVKNSEQISRRLQEIRKFTGVDSISESSEIQELKKCISSPEEKSELNEAVGHIAESNTLKARFFELEAEKRNLLIENYRAKNLPKSDRNLLGQEVEKAENLLNRAQKKLDEAKTVEASGELKDEDLTAAIQSLQQYLASHANDHLAFLKLIGEKKQALEEIKKDLTSVLKEEKNSDAKPKDLLFAATQNWERTVDFISGLFKGLQISAAVDLPAPMSPKASLSDAESKEYSRYMAEYADAQKGRLDQTQKRTQIVNELRSQAFLLSSEAGQLRSRLFSRCDKTGDCGDYRALNERNLSDIAREIEMIPVKVRAGGISKFLEIKGKFNSGVDGWIDLFQQIVALFVLFLIPLFLFKLLSWLNVKLDSTRRSVLSQSTMDFQRRAVLALWISRLNPFVPAAGMAFGIWIARQLIETTDLQEVSQLLFYFQLYFIYRIFKLLMQIGLEVLFTSESVADLRGHRELVETSARRISRLIFVEYAFLHLIETSVRKALLYGIISSFVFCLNILFVLWECWKWKAQITDAYSRRFAKHNRFLQKVSESKLLLFISSPFLVAAVILHDLVQFSYSHLIRLDFVKKIHAEIFRRRIEAEAEDQRKITPKPEYLKKFDDDLPVDTDIFVDREKSPSSVIAKTVEAWVSGVGTDDLMIVVGNRGMGKTTVLEAVARKLGGDVRVHRPPVKTLKLESFYEFLSSVLGAEVKSVEEVLHFDAQLSEKKVFVIDDIQNFFLGRLGGFEVYKTFVAILSLQTKNIFWCISINSRSWSYLRGALGKEHLYGRTFDLLPWKDFEIQDLILKRHALSGFERQFEQSIKAYGATGDTLGQQAETQFFRLLWGQSRGNPRSALMHWISAVSQADDNTILVGVPTFLSSSAVGTMSDDALFLLAAIARHESLTEAEMQDVTGIASTVIRKCMKDAFAKDLVWSDSSGRYRIPARAQYGIDYFLIGKNFLYE